jgi:K+-transporting ATPase A subunit
MDEVTYGVGCFSAVWLIIIVIVGALASIPLIAIGK